MDSSPANQAIQDGGGSDLPRWRARVRARLTLPAGSLKALTVLGSVWTIGGFGVAQLMRLGGNLVLTRLVAPEVFGIMAVVNVVMESLRMLSDLGVEAAVIQCRDGDRPNFLNTARTIEIGRGGVLFAAACALGWGMAVLYDKPILLPLTVFTGLSVVLMGFESTSLMSLRRHMRLGRLTTVELSSQAVALAVMLGWAWVRPSVWALAGGAVSGALARLIISHMLRQPFRHHLAFDRAAISDIYRLGRWIFLSTILTLVATRLDRLFLAKLLDWDTVGVYQIAVMLALVVPMLVGAMAHKVIFPSLSRINRESPERLSEVYYRLRLGVDLLLQPMAGFFAFGGAWLITLLYPADYAAAGWMLQILSIRSAMYAVAIPCETALSSRGYTQYGLIHNLIVSIWVCAGIPLGFHFGGLVGVVWTIGCAEAVALPVVWIAFARHGLLRPVREMWALLLFGVGGLIAAAVSGVF